MENLNLVYEGKKITTYTKYMIKPEYVFSGDFLMSGKQVATALGYKNHNDALLKHVPAEDKTLLRNSMLTESETKLNNAGEIFINEAGLYSLIFNSQLESAKDFKKWVFNEVLPTIRKTGQFKIKDHTQLTEHQLKLMMEKIVYEEIIHKRTDLLQESINYLRTLGITKRTATELAYKSLKYQMNINKIYEDYLKEQKEKEALKVEGKIRVGVRELTLLGYSHADAWNKFAEVATKETGLDIKEQKKKRTTSKQNVTYINIVNDLGVSKDALKALNRCVGARKRSIAKKAQ